MDSLIQVLCQSAGLPEAVAAWHVTDGEGCMFITVAVIEVVTMLLSLVRPSVALPGPAP